MNKEEIELIIKRLKEIRMMEMKPDLLAQLWRLQGVLTEIVTLFETNRTDLQKYRRQYEKANKEGRKEELGLKKEDEYPPTIVFED